MNENETNKILKEILKWQRVTGIDFLKKKVEEADLFKDPKEIFAYYHSNGDKSSRDLAEISGLGYKTVQSLWKRWVEFGIVEPVEKYKGGRYKRIFELHELGLEFPEKTGKKEGMICQISKN